METVIIILTAVLCISGCAFAYWSIIDTRKKKTVSEWSAGIDSLKAPPMPPTMPSAYEDCEVFGVQPPKPWPRYADTAIFSGDKVTVSAEDNLSSSSNDDDCCGCACCDCN